MIFTEKHLSEATFRGQEFLSYNTSRRPIEPLVSTADQVSLYFKSRQPSGLLFFSSDGLEDYISLSLKEGAINLIIKLGASSVEATVKPPRVRFDDNQWHKVLVHRQVREVGSF